MRYVVLYHLTRGTLPELQQTRPELLAGHSQLMGQLHRQGKVLMGGPFTPVAGSTAVAMAVFEAPSEEDVRSCLNRDPIITSGAGRGEVYPWHSAFGAA